MIAAAALLASSAAMAQSTTVSPTGGALPAGVTPVGGIVADLTGANGTRVVAQVSASTLFSGFASSNPQVIGTQTGFDPATIAALGGGLTGASFRVTLYDGDSAPGDFDGGTDTSFLVDGVFLDFWGNLATVQTTDTGAFINTGVGFGDEILSTGFFSTTNAVFLAALFGNLADGSLTYSLSDTDSGDNFLDFTRGVAGGLINVGSGPVVTPPGGVPEPGTWALMLLGFGAIGASLRRRRSARPQLAAA
jgi:hypothetical protein